MVRFLVMIASLVFSSLPLYAATYTLEPDYTQGVFRWNHLGFSSPAAQFAQGEEHAGIRSAPTHDGLCRGHDFHWPA